MRALLLLLAFCTAAVALTLLMQVNDGFALIVLPPYRIDLSLNAVILLQLVAFAVVYGLLRLVFVTLDLPNRVRAYHLQRAEQQARENLLEALQAFLEGRYNRCEKAAAKAMELENRVESKVLAALLGARAAHMIRDYDKRDGYLAQVESFDQRPNLATLMTRAELLFDQRLTDDALHALEQVKKLAPKLTSGLRLELRIRQKRNEPEPMLKLLEQLQKSDAIDVLQAEQLRLHAYLLQVQGNNGGGKQLRDWWAKLPASDRLQPRLAAAVARRLLGLGECQLAGKVIIDTLEKNWDQELIELFGQFPEWETPCTDNLLKNIQRAETWLPQHPNDAELLLALDRLCHAQELWGKAQSYLEASIAVRPSVAAHLELAEMLEQHGRHDQASPHFKACLKLALHARQ